MASMWISEGLAKLLDRTPGDPINDHHFFMQQLQSMADSHPIPAIGSLIDSLLVQNAATIVWFVILIELFIGTTILFGLFTRIGSFFGMIMALTLWIITLGWGEWIFTYPFIFTPMLVIFISNSSKEIGLDYYYDFSPKKIQINAFEKQIELAVELNRNFASEYSVVKAYLIMYFYPQKD